MSDVGVRRGPAGRCAVSDSEQTMGPRRSMRGISRLRRFAPRHLGGPGCPLSKLCCRFDSAGAARPDNLSAAGLGGLR